MFTSFIKMAVLNLEELTEDFTIWQGGCLYNLPKFKSYKIPCYKIRKNPSFRSKGQGKINKTIGQEQSTTVVAMAFKEVWWCMDSSVLKHLANTYDSSS